MLLRISDGSTAPSTHRLVNRSLVHPASRTGRKYLEVIGVIAAVTTVAWFVPIDYCVWGDVYLVAIIALCLRVGQWPIGFAAVSSVLAWNFVIVPPRLSFSRLDLKDGVFLGTYFAAALLAGKVTAIIRAKEKSERQREQRTSALFRLSRSLTSAQTLDEAISAALRQAEALFGVQTAVLLLDENGRVAAHPANSLQLTPKEFEAAAQSIRDRDGEKLDARMPGAARRWLQVSLVRRELVLGALCLGKWPTEAPLTDEGQELIETFAAQIALLLERERFRSTSERQKLLAESDRLHRTLLDRVSHELKPPIAVLRSTAENLTADDGLSRSTLAEELRTATDRLDRLVGNLLHQSRLEAGRLIAQLDWCDARDIIGATRRTVDDSLPDRPLQISVPVDMPLFRADFVLLEQCLVNLLNNAILHAPAGTGIEVPAGIDRVSDRVYLAVRDHGPGIAADVRAKLFQKFSRGPNAGTGGLGLGLSIVRGFMDAQNREATAENHPSGGAVFTLSLPSSSHSTLPPE